MIATEYIVGLIGTLIGLAFAFDIPQSIYRKLKKKSE